MQLTKRRIIILGVLSLVLAGGAVWLFLVNRFVRVPTGAMANTILPGESLIVDRLVTNISRGDIIIFKHPQENSVQYVSRVVGMPGETIEIRDTKVLINQKELGEIRVAVEMDMDMGPSAMREISSEGEGTYRVFYYSPREELVGVTTQPFGHQIQLLGVDKPFQVPDDHYFVMGDNRDNSQDSRYLGPIARSLITGKPYFTYWSVERGELGGSERIRWNRVFSKLK